jgi:PAS domain S-box-containing protein
MEASPTGMLLLDATGRIVLVNAQIEKLFGYDRSALIGQPIEILVPERLRNGYLGFRAGSFDDAIERGNTAEDLYGLRKDGSEVPVEIGLTPLKTPEGTVILSSVLDVSEHKRIEHDLRVKSQELERSNHDLEQFACVASHDLREPLRMVATYVGLLEAEYADKLDAAGRDYIRFAVQGAQRMSRLISDLLAYARIGARSTALEPVSCADAMQEALSALRTSIRESDAEIVVGALPWVRGDATQLSLVFQNLLENALKFRSERRPRICIAAEKRGDDWELRIEDNGIGIEPRFFSRIFELFQRLHAQDQYAGTGMGLALCKRVVERHGGSIGVESTYGVGTVFFLRFPALPEAHQVCDDPDDILLISHASRRG